MFKKIDHVEIVPKDFERSVEFYSRILGFKKKLTQRIEGSSLGFAIDVAYLDLGGTAVELIAYRGAQPAPPPSQEMQLGYRLMALEVEDMAQAIEYLRKNQVEIHREPRIFEKEKYARAEIKDPDGFRIELRQWL